MKTYIKLNKTFPEVYWVMNAILGISGKRLNGEITISHPVLISHLKHKIPNNRYVFIFTSYKEKVHNAIIRKPSIFLYGQSLTAKHKKSLIHLNEKHEISKFVINNNDYIKKLEPEEAIRFKNAYIKYKEIRNRSERRM